MLTQNKKILFIGKYFPIQGGISSSSIQLIHDLLKLGIDVHVLTNSGEVESGFRQIFDKTDMAELMDYFPKKPIVHQINRNPQILHIPFSPIYGERLFGKGLEVTESFDFDLIVSWYYQPYGIVAARLSEHTGIPFTVCNAGSDLARLSNDSNLKRTYAWMLSKANYIFSGKGSKELIHKLYAKEIGDRFRQLKGKRILPEAFKSQGPIFNLEKFSRLAKERYLHVPFFKNGQFISKLIPDKALDPTLPIFGMYGKCGEFKGSWDVLETLNKLVSKGYDFQFIYLASGTERQLSLLYKKVINAPNLIGKVWILPSVPFFQVPNFIRLCDAIFILERKAPIAIHNLSTPSEVLAVGTALVISGEVVNKSNLKVKLKDGDNAIIIDDPENHIAFAEQLEKAIKNKTFSEIGRKGELIYNELTENFNVIHSLAYGIENIIV